MGIRAFLASDLLINRETSAPFHDGAAKARLASPLNRRELQSPSGHFVAQIGGIFF
jgi:hypothetical protein